MVVVMASVGFDPNDSLKEPGAVDIFVEPSYFDSFEEPISLTEDVEVQLFSLYNMGIDAEESDVEIKQTYVNEDKTYYEYQMVVYSEDTPVFVMKRIIQSLIGPDEF